MQATFPPKVRLKPAAAMVVGGGSNRTHDPLFQRAVRQVGLNPYLMELVNLREQCSRVHRWQVLLANRKVQELIRIAVARISKAQAVHKQLHHTVPSTLVIGGGLAGITWKALD